MKRREFLGAGAAALAGCVSLGREVTPHVLVIGAGFGGATCAKYLATGDPELQVVLVDRVQEFVSCPMSNLVLGGSRSMAQLTRRLDGLKKHRIDVLWGEAVAIDPSRRVVRFGRGSELVYDRLVLAPGVDFVLQNVAGYGTAPPRVLHAWKAGTQTVELRRQLEAMDDGGVFKREKPRSKVLVLDANPDVAVEGPLFKRAWEELYPGMVEYRPNSKVLGVDPAAMKCANERRDDKRCRAQRHSGAARRRHRLPRRACRSPARWRIRRPRSAPPP